MAKTEKEIRAHNVRLGSKKRTNALNRISNDSFFKKHAYTFHYLYGRKCAICGWRASKEHANKSGSYGNQIHHIISVKNNGENNFSNLIPLCPNHHKQADLGILSIEELRKFQIKNEDVESVWQLRQDEDEKESDNLFKKSDGAITYCTPCVCVIK